MKNIDDELLLAVADLHDIPTGAYNIRKNGSSIRNTTQEIEIVPKKDVSGIDIIVKPDVKNKSVHIPVIITQGGFTDLVYNDFYIGNNAEVTIIAGCGIHNDTSEKSQHDGIHSFHLGENCKVNYIEKHIGLGKGQGEKVLNPTTLIEMERGSCFTMETLQIKGVASSKRKTLAKINEDAKLVIKEKILTTENQSASTDFEVRLLGKNSSVELISRSVAKDNSLQIFNSNIIGENECFGHVECDGILVGNAKIVSVPQITCNNVEATLVHEAAIGKIAGEQIVKLMTLGFTESQAEDIIIKGFLK